jgi:hypothetical protein
MNKELNNYHVYLDKWGIDFWKIIQKYCFIGHDKTVNTNKERKLEEDFVNNYNKRHKT